MSDRQADREAVKRWLNSPYDLLQSDTVWKMAKALAWYATIFEHPSTFALDYLKKDGGKVAMDALKPIELALPDIAPPHSEWTKCP